MQPPRPVEPRAGGAAQLSIYGATFLRALDWYFHPAAHVVVVGDPGAPETSALWRAARVTYRPRKVLTLLGSAAPRSQLPAPLQAMMDGKVPRAYVCVGQHCGPPADSAGALEETIATLRVA